MLKHQTSYSMTSPHLEHMLKHQTTYSMTSPHLEHMLKHQTTYSMTSPHLEHMLKHQTTYSMTSPQSTRNRYSHSAVHSLMADGWLWNSYTQIMLLNKSYLQHLLKENQTPLVRAILRNMKENSLKNVKYYLNIELAFFV